MALRSFNCLRCGQKFESFTADFILPWDQICDACLVECWPYVGQALRQQIALRLAGQPETHIEAIASAIERYRQEMPDVQQIIQRRVWLRIPNAVPRKSV